MAKNIEDCDFLKKMSSSEDTQNIKSVSTKIAIPLFVVEFEYDTRRGNHRTQKRKVVQITEEDAAKSCMEWISTNNTNEPYRAMLNAKILSVVKAGIGKVVIC